MQLSLNAAHHSMGFPVSGNWRRQWSLTTDQARVHASCVLFCCCSIIKFYSYGWFTKLLALPGVKKLMKAAYWSTGLPVSGNWMDQWSIHIRVYAIRISFVAGEKLTEAAHWSTGLHRPAYCKLHGPTVSVTDQVRVRMHSQCMIYKPEPLLELQLTGPRAPCFHKPNWAW